MREPYENATELRATLVGRAVPRVPRRGPILSREPPTHSPMKQTIHHWLSGSKPAALPGGILALLLSLYLAPFAFAQGPLTPPGAPQPTMKSLQEIWNELQSVKSTVTSQAAEIAALKSLQQRSSATVLHYATGGSLPWSLTTVDSAGIVGYATSLAFGPDGQPAISYYDGSNLDLKFARMGIFTPRP